MATKLKSKKPNPTVQRQTLAKRIRLLADCDIVGAIQLAESGRQFNPAERELKTYFRDIGDLHTMKAATKSPVQDERRLLQEIIKWDRQRFARNVISAIDSLNAEYFFEMGEALKNIRKGADAADRFRAAILKLRLETMRTKNPADPLTIRELASRIGWPVNDSADGSAHLRRLCKELGYPLRPSRQTRRK